MEELHKEKDKQIEITPQPVSKNEAQEIIITASVYQEDIESETQSSQKSVIKSSHPTPAQQQNVSESIRLETSQVEEMSHSGLQNIDFNLDQIEKQFSISPVVTNVQEKPSSTTFRSINKNDESQYAIGIGNKSLEMMTELHITEDRNTMKDVGKWSQHSTLEQGNDIMDESDTSSSDNGEMKSSTSKRAKFGVVERNVKGRFDDSAC